MDLHLYLRVLWRFRLLVIVGVAFASSLGVLTIARIDLNGSPRIQHREPETWVSYTTLFVTQQGFPEGRTSVEEGDVTLADPIRFSSLAILYSKLVDSDAVLEILLRDGPIQGTIEAAPVLTSDRSNADALPLVSIAALAQSPRLAESLALRHAKAFREYLRTQQAIARIPKRKRVVMEIVKQPTAATLFASRSSTSAVVVFLTIMMAILALCFLLENLRPQLRVSRDEEPAPAELRARRSA